MRGPDGSPEASPSLDLMAVHNARRVTILEISSDGAWNEIASITTDDRVRGLAFNTDGSKLAIGDFGTPLRRRHRHLAGGPGEDA